MKTFLSIIALAFMVFFAFGCQVQREDVDEESAVDVEAEESAIQNLVREAFEVEQRKDVDAIIELGFFAENVVVQAPNTPQFEGLEALRSFYTELFEVLVSIEGASTRVEVSAAGDMAWEYGWNRAVYEGPDGPIEDQGKYFEVFEKLDGAWKVVAISFSSDKPTR